MVDTQERAQINHFSSLLYYMRARKGIKAFRNLHHRYFHIAKGCNLAEEKSYSKYSFLCIKYAYIMHFMHYSCGLCYAKFVNKECTAFHLFSDRSRAPK